MSKFSKIISLFLVLLFLGGQVYSQDSDNAELLNEQDKAIADQLQAQGITQEDLPGERGADLTGKLEESMNSGLDSFRAVPYAQAFEHIKTRVENSITAPLFKRIPKSYALLTNLLRDEVAPKKFFGILKDRKRLVTFALISLALIIISWRIKKKRRAKKLPFGEVLVQGLGHFVFFNGVKLSLIWFFFNPEITPILRVIAETYNG